MKINSENFEVEIMEDVSRATLTKNGSDKKTIIGDFYGGAYMGIISKKEKFCALCSDGIIIYYLEEPFRNYMWKYRCAQWKDWGRFKGDGIKSIWINSIEYIDEDYIAVETLNTVKRIVDVNNAKFRRSNNKISIESKSKIQKILEENKKIHVGEELAWPPAPSQQAIDLKSGELIVDDIKKATKTSLDNLKKYLEEEIGIGIEMCDEIYIFLIDLSHVDEVNDEYELYFDGKKPKVCYEEVAFLADDGKIEIEVII